MKKLKLLLPLLSLMLISCGGEGNNTDSTQTPENRNAQSDNQKSTEDYDPTRGEGSFKDVAISSEIDMSLVTIGQEVVDTKCFACHRMNEDKLVGPGWKGVTLKHKPEWILNFITNPDPMLDKDPELQAQLEICLVRMTNQNLTENDALGVYEFMRKNDADQGVTGEPGSGYNPEEGE